MPKNDAIALLGTLTAGACLGRMVLGSVCETGYYYNDDDDDTFKKKMPKNDAIALLGTLTAGACLGRKDYDCNEMQSLKNQSQIVVS